MNNRTPLGISGPILLCFDDKVLPCERDVIEYWRFRKSADALDIISVIEPARVRSSCFNWFVNAQGKLVFFKELERKPRTPSLLKTVINFTRIYYRLSTPRQTTIGELIELSNGKHGAGRISISSAAKKHGVDILLTKEMFMRDILHEENTSLEYNW